MRRSSWFVAGLLAMVAWPVADAQETPAEDTQWVSMVGPAAWRWSFHSGTSAISVSDVGILWAIEYESYAGGQLVEYGFAARFEGALGWATCLSSFAADGTFVGAWGTIEVRTRPALPCAYVDATVAGPSELGTCSGGAVMTSDPQLVVPYAQGSGAGVGACGSDPD